jgi:hypothetical protein
VVGLPLGSDGPLLDDPDTLEAYLNRLHDLQQRDIVADAIPANVGQRFTHDRDDQVGKIRGRRAARRRRRGAARCGRGDVRGEVGRPRPDTRSTRTACTSS